MQVTSTKKEPPQWLLDMWKEIDDKSFGKGLDCFTEDAVCNLGVADWKGREAIRTNLRAFIDTGFTTLHHVSEYWDAGFLKVFRGVVDMAPDDRSGPTVHPTMTHFFYMDEKDQTKVRWWPGAVGPISFGQSPRPNHRVWMRQCLWGQFCRPTATLIAISSTSRTPAS